MPQHTPSERRKRKDTGILQSARNIITEKIGGFGKREATQAQQRATVSGPFTGAPGQRERRRALIGKARPIIKPVATRPKAQSNGTQSGNLPQGITGVEDLLKKRKRQLENAL